MGKHLYYKLIDTCCNDTIFTSLNFLFFEYSFVEKNFFFAFYYGKNQCLLYFTAFQQKVQKVLVQHIIRFPL